MRAFVQKGKWIWGVALVVVMLGLMPMSVHASSEIPGGEPASTEPPTTTSTTDAATGLNETTEDYSIPEGSAYIEGDQTETVYTNTDSANAVQNALGDAIKYATNSTTENQQATIVVNDGTYLGGLQLDNSEKSTLGQILQQMVADKVTEKLTGTENPDATATETATTEAKTEVETAVKGITIRIVAKDALGANNEILTNASGNANMEGAINIDGLNIVLAGIYLSTNGTIGISNAEKFEYYGTGKDDVVDINVNDVSDTIVVDGGEGNDKIDVTVVQSPNVTLDITAEMVDTLTGEAKTAYDTLDGLVSSGGTLTSQDAEEVATNLTTIVDAFLQTPTEWNKDIATNITVSGGKGNDDISVELRNATDLACTYAKTAEGVATGSLIDFKLDLSKVALEVSGNAGNDRLNVSGGMEMNLAAQFLNTILDNIGKNINEEKYGNLSLSEKSSITLNGGTGDDVLTADTTAGYSAYFRNVDWSADGGEGYDRLHLTGKLDTVENAPENLTIANGTTSNEKNITAKTRADLTFLSGTPLEFAIGKTKDMNIISSNVEAYTDELANKKSTSIDLSADATEGVTPVIESATFEAVTSYTDYILTAVSKKDSNDSDAYSYVNFELFNTILQNATNLLFSNIIIKLADSTSKLVVNNLKAAGFNVLLSAEQIQILGNVIGKNILMTGSNENVWEVGLDVAEDDLNSANDVSFDFTIEQPKTKVNITIEDGAVVTADQTIDMVVVSEQDGFYLQANILNDSSLLEALNFFTYKDGNASIDIKGKLIAKGPIQAISKVVIVSDTASNAFKAFIPVGVCIAVSDSHINISGNAEVNSVSSILMRASNYIELNSQARAGVAPVALAFCLALPDTYVRVSDDATLIIGGDVYLLADAVVRMVAVATGPPVNNHTTESKSGGYIAVIVAEQDTDVTIKDRASIDAGGKIELISDSMVNANSASISVPSEPKAVNAKGIIGFVEKIMGVTTSKNQSLTGKLVGGATGSKLLGNLFQNGTAGSEDPKATESTKKSSTQFVGAFAVNFVSNSNKVLVNTSENVKARGELLLHAFATTISYAKADGSLYKPPSLFPGYTVAGDSNNALGIGIAVVYYDHDNTAKIEKGKITANGLTVKAETGRSIASAITKAGHIPTKTADFGLGGAITVQVASDNTAATLGKDATYTIGNHDVNVLATANHTYITVADASGKRATKFISVPVIGFKIPITQEMYNKNGTGVGAGIAVYVGGGDVTANVEDGAVFTTSNGVNANNVKVYSDRLTKETVIAEAGAGGGKAVAPVIATVVSGYSAESYLGLGTTIQDYYNGNADVTASNQVIRKIKADAAAVGVSAGMGGSFVVAVINDSSNASLKRNVNAININVLAKGISRFTADSKASATGANPATVTSSSGESSGSTVTTIINSIKNLATGSGTAADGESVKAPSAETSESQKGEADKIADQNINSAKKLSENVNSKNINNEKIEKLTANRQQAQTSEGNVQVAAAFAVNVMQHVVAALVGDGLTLTARGNATEGSGLFKVEAINDTDAIISANASATNSKTGVGVGAAVNVVTFENKAILGYSKVVAKQLVISADTLEAAEAESLEAILADLITFLAETADTKKEGYNDSNNLLLIVLEKQLGKDGLKNLIDTELAKQGSSDVANDSAAVKTILISEMVSRLTGKKAADTASDLVQAVVESLLKEVMDSFLKPENLIEMVFTGHSSALNNIMAKASYMAEASIVKIKKAMNTYLRMKFGSNDEMEGVGHKISTTAISGAGAANIGIAGAVAVTVINGTTEAVIADSISQREATDIAVTGDVSLNARHAQKVYNTATAAADKKGAADKNKNATSTSTGDSSKSVGVGAAAAVTIINATVDAGVGKNRTITAGTMSIVAKIYDDVETISVAGSDPIARRQKTPVYVPTLGETPTPEQSANTTGTKDISVDASAAVGLINNTVNAHVKDGTKITTTGIDTIKLSNTEFVNFYMHSEQHGETLASASAFAVGGSAAVGACAAVNLPASDVTTTLSGDVVTAGSAKIDSYTYDADESHAYATVVGASLDRYLDKLRDMLQLASLNAGQSTNGLNAAFVNKLNGVINTAKTTGASKVSGFLPASVSALISQKVSTGAAPDTTSKTTGVGGANAQGQSMDSSAKAEQSINIAAAVAVNVTKHKAITIMNGSLIAMSVKILAENHGNFRTLGTGATVTGPSDASANNISLGVAVSSNKNESSATVDGRVIATGAVGTTETTATRNGDITVDATLTQNMDGDYKGLLAAQALAGSISGDGGTVGFSGAVAVLVGSAVTTVNIADGSVIEGKNLVFNAGDKSKYAVRAGSVTVSKGASAGIGASYAMIYANNKTIVMVGEKYSAQNPVSGVSIKGETLSIKAVKYQVSMDDYKFPLGTDVLFTVDAGTTDKGLINLTTTDGEAGKYSIDIALSSDDFLLVFDMLNHLASVNYYTEAIAGSILAGEGTKFALAGAMALVFLNNETRAELGDKVSINLTGDMKQEAIEDTNVRMITGSLSASNANVGVGLSVTSLDDKEKVESITGNDVTIRTNGDVKVTADNKANVMAVTVAAAATVGAEGKATIGGAINVINSKNTINAIMGERNIVNAKNVLIHAENTSDYTLINTSVSGATAGVAVGGTVAVILMDNATLTSILKGTQITASGDVTTEAVSNEELFNILASISGAAQSAAVAGTLGVIITESNTEASLKDEVRITAGKDINVLATGNVKQFMVLASAAVSGSSAAVGATITVDVMEHTVKAVTGEGCVLDAGGNVLISADGTDDIFLITAAGTVSASGPAAVSGAIPVVISDSTIEATIGQANTVKADDSVGVFAVLNSDFYNIAGSMAATGGTAGVGATIQTLVMENNILAQVLDFSSITALASVSGGTGVKVPNREERRKGLSVYADLNSNLLFASVSGAAAGTAAVGGVVDTVVINNTTLAVIGNHVAVNAREHRDSATKHITSSSKTDEEAGADAAVSVEAVDHTKFYHIAGALSVGATAGVGATVAVTIFNNIVKAQIANGAHIYANGDINVKASSQTELPIIIVTFGLGGTAGVAGAVSVALFDNEVEASVGAAVILVSNKNININAISNNKIISAAAAVAVSGTTAVGAVSPTIKFTGTTSAFADNESVLSAVQNVIIKADSKEDIYGFAADLAASGTASVAGTVEVILTEVITKAYTGSNVTISGDNVSIIATDDFKLFGAAGTASGGGVAGVGLSVLVSLSYNTVSAYTGSNNTITAKRDITIQATDNRDVSVYAITAGVGGTAAVSGTVVVTIVGSKLSKDSFENIDKSPIKPQANVDAAFAACNNEKATTYKDKASVDAISNANTSTEGSNAGAVKGDDFKLANENSNSTSQENGEDKYTVNDGLIDNEANKTPIRPISIKKDTISAVVGSNSTLTAGTDITIDAADYISLDMITGTMAVGLYAGVGIGVSVGILYSNVLAYTEADVTLSAGGDIQVTATGAAVEKTNADSVAKKNVSNAKDSYSVRVITVGGAAGAAGVSVSTASLDVYTVTKAFIGARNIVEKGATLTVEANSNYGKIIVWNLAASGGVVGVNASVTRGNYDATVSAYIAADGTIKNITGKTKVALNSDTTLDVIGVAVSGGAVGANAVVILSFYTTSMEAFIGQGTSMTNCGALEMGANANVTAKAEQASITGGAVAAGVSVVMVKLTPTILTYAGATPEGFKVNAAATGSGSGTLAVSSVTMKNNVTSNATIDSASVAAGGVSGNGLVAIVMNRTKSYVGIVKTNVTATGDISIIALMNANSDVDAIAAQIGTSAAVGAIAGYSELKTLNKAGMDLTGVTVNGANVKLQAGDANNISIADTNVITGSLAGIVAVTINVALANNAYENVALINGNGGTLNATGDITIETNGKAVAKTEIKGIAVSCVSVGVSLGMTYLKAISKAGIEGINTINGRNINITSNLNSKDNDYTAVAVVRSAAGGLIGVNGAVGVAASRATNIATASGNILATGDLNVIANGKAKAKAETLSATAGLITVGLMSTAALAEGTYKAYINNNSTSKIQARNIQVLCNTDTDAYSATQAATGGVKVAYASVAVNVAYARAKSVSEAAIIGSGKQLTATGNVTVQSQGTARAVADAKGANAAIADAALFKMSATNGISSLETKMSSYVKDQKDMIVNGALIIQTLFNNTLIGDYVGNRTNGAYAVAGSNAAANISMIGGEEAFAKATQKANSEAYIYGSNINVTNALTIKALSNSLAYADINSNNFGIGGGIGAIFTRALTEGTTKAYITASTGTVAAKTLTILSQLTTSNAIANSAYLSGGVVNVSVLDAVATNNAKVHAYIDGNNGTVDIGGNTSIEAKSENNIANATVRGVAAVSAIKVGNARTEANLKSDVRAYTAGSHTIKVNGNLSILATNKGSVKAYSTNSSSAKKGVSLSLIGLTGAESFAKSNLITEAKLENGSTSVQGNIDVKAMDTATIVATNLKGVEVSVIGIGVMIVKTESNNQAKAGIGNNSKVVANGDINVKATSNTTQTLESEVTSFGVVNGTSMYENAKSTGTVTVYVGNNANVSAGRNIGIVGDNTMKVKLAIKEFNVSGISLGAYNITTDTNSTVNGKIGTNAKLTALEDINIAVNDFINVDNQIVLFAAGLYGGTVSITSNTAKQDVTISIGDNAVIHSGKNTMIAASTDHIMLITAAASQYGIASATAVAVKNTLTRNCIVTIGDYVTITADNGDIIIVAYSVPKAIGENGYAMTATATGTSGGLFNAAGAKAENKLVSNTNITIGKGGNIETTYGTVKIAAETGSSAYAYAYRKAVAAVSANTTEADLYIENPVSVYINGTADARTNIIGRDVEITAINSWQKLKAEGYCYMLAAGAVAKSNVNVTIYADQTINIKGANIRGYDSVTITAMASNIDHDFTTYSEIIGAVGVVYATTIVNGHMKATVTTDDNTEIASANIDIQAFAPALTNVNHVVKAEAVANTILSLVFKIIGYVVKWVMKAVAWFVGLFSKKAKKKIEEAVYGWVEEIQSTTAYPTAADGLKPNVDSQLNLNGKISVGGAAAGIMVDIYENGTVNAIGVEDSAWLNKVVVDHVNKTVTIPYIYNMAEGALNIYAGEGNLYGNLKVYLNNYLPYITFKNHSDYTLILSDITVFNSDVNPIDIAVTAANNRSNLTVRYGAETPIITVLADKASDVIFNGEINNVKGQLNLQLNGGNVYIGDGGIQNQDELLRGDTEFLTKMFEGTNIWVNTLVITGANNIGTSADNRLQIGLIRYVGYQAVGDTLGEPDKDAMVDVTATGNIYAGFALLEVMVSEETLSEIVLNNLAPIKNLYLKHIKAGGTADIYLPAAKRLYVYKDGTNYEGMEIAYPGDYTDTYLFVPNTSLFAGGESYIVKDTGGHDSKYIITKDGLFTLTGELEVDSDIFLSGDMSGIQIGDQVTSLFVYNLPDGTDVYVTETGKVVMITSGTTVDKLALNLDDVKFEKRADGTVILTINDSNTGTDSFISIVNGVPTMNIGSNGVTITIQPQADGSWLLPNGIKVHMMFTLIDGTKNHLVSTTYLGETSNGNRRYMIGNILQDSEREDHKYYVFDIKTVEGTSTFVEAYLYTKETITTAGRTELYRDQTLEEAISAAGATITEELNKITEITETTAQTLAGLVAAKVTSGIQVAVTLTQQRRIVEEAIPSAEGQFRSAAYYQMVISLVLKDIASNKTSDEFTKRDAINLGQTPFFADTLSGVNTDTETENSKGNGTVYEEPDNIPGRIKDGDTVTDDGTPKTGTGELNEDEVTDLTDAETIAKTEIDAFDVSKLETGNEVTTLNAIINSITAKIGSNIWVKVAMPEATEIYVDEAGNTVESNVEGAIKKKQYTITFTISDDTTTKEITKTFEIDENTTLNNVEETTKESGNAKIVTTIAQAENEMQTAVNAVTELKTNTLETIFEAIQNKVSPEVVIEVTYKKTGFDTATMLYSYEVTSSVTIGSETKSYAKTFQLLAKQSTLESAKTTAKTVLDGINVNDFAPYASSATTLTETVKNEITKQIYGNVNVDVKLEQTEAISNYGKEVEGSVNAYTYSYTLKVTLTDRLNNTLAALTEEKTFTNAKWLLGTRPYVTVTEETPNWSDNTHQNDADTYAQNGTAARSEAGTHYGTGYELNFTGTNMNQPVLVKEDSDKDSGYILRYGANEFEIEKLEAEKIGLENAGTAIFRLANGTYTGQKLVVYNALKDYILAISSASSPTLSVLKLTDTNTQDKSKIYTIVSGDVQFTEGSNLVINRVLAEYPGAVTESRETEYVYVSMTPASEAVANEERTLLNSVVYISALSNRLIAVNPFIFTEEEIAAGKNPYKTTDLYVTDKEDSRDIYALATDDIALDRILTGKDKDISGNNKKYYKIGYISYDTEGNAIYHIFVENSGELQDVIFNPFTPEVQQPTEPTAPQEYANPTVVADPGDTANEVEKQKYQEYLALKKLYDDYVTAKAAYDAALPEYTRQKAAYDEYAKLMDYARAMFADTNIIVVKYDQTGNIVFDMKLSKDKGIVLNPNGTVYYEKDNVDFVIPLVSGTDYFMLTQTARVHVTGNDVVYDYLDAAGKVYASHNLSQNEMKWFTPSGNLTFSTNNFRNEKVTLSAGYKLQGTKVSEHVVTVLNGSEFFYTEMNLVDGKYILDYINYADLSTDPARQIWLVQTKADGMFTEIKEVYSNEGTTIRALVADNTQKSKTRVATFNKADLVGGGMMQAISIRDDQYNPVMMAMRTEMGSYYIFPNGYTIGVLAGATGEDGDNSVFFISQIIIEKFRNTQPVSGSGYLIGNIEANEVVLTFDDEHAEIKDVYAQGTTQAIKAEKITIVASTDTQIGTEEKPFRIDVTSLYGGFRIVDENGVFNGTAFVKDVAGDMILNDMVIGANATLNLYAVEDIETRAAINRRMRMLMATNTSRNAVIGVEKGGNLLLDADANIGSASNAFNVYGFEGGIPIQIKDADNVYLNGYGSLIPGTVIEALLPQTGFTGVIEVTNVGDIRITLPTGDMKILNVSSQSGNVELNATTGAIESADNEDTTKVSGHNITLNAGTTVGGTTPLRTDVTPVYGVNGTMSVNATGNVAINEVSGSLILKNLSTAGDVNLNVPNGSVETSAGTVLTGNNLNVNAGSVGATQTPFTTDIAGVMDIVATTGNLNLSQNASINASRLQAAGNVAITTNGDILPSNTESYQELLALKEQIAKAKADWEAAKTVAETAQDYADGLAAQIATLETQKSELETKKSEVEQELIDAQDPVLNDRTTMTEEEIEELDKKIADLTVKQASFAKEIGDLTTVIAALVADNTAVTPETKTPAQLAADTAKSEADSKQTAYETLQNQLAAKQQAVERENALISAGGNMNLNAGGKIGTSDKYLSITAGGRLDATGTDIYIGTTGSLLLGDITANSQTGTLELLALGNISSSGVISKLKANEGSIVSVNGNLGTKDNQLRTNFYTMDLVGNNIYNRSGKDVIIGIIAATETAEINIVGNLTGSGNGTDITANNLTLRVNGDMGSETNPINIQAPNANLYVGSKLNAVLTAKDVSSTGMEAGSEANIKVNGNLKEAVIAAPKLKLDVDGKLGSQESPIDIQSNNATMNSKMNQVFIKESPFVPKKEDVKPNPGYKVDTGSESMDVLLSEYPVQAIIAKVLVMDPAIVEKTAQKVITQSTEEEQDTDTTGTKDETQTIGKEPSMDEDVKSKQSAQDQTQKDDTTDTNNTATVMLIVLFALVACNVGIFAARKKSKGKNAE